MRPAGCGKTRSWRCALPSPNHPTSCPEGAGGGPCAAPIRRIAAINDAIRKIATEENVLLVDADALFATAAESGLIGFDLIEDYVHPNDEGHVLLARHVWSAIEKSAAAWDSPADPDVLFVQPCGFDIPRTLEEMPLLGAHQAANAALSRQDIQRVSVCPPPAL